MPHQNNYPQGEYEAVITEHGFQVSSNDNLMLTIKIKPLTYKGDVAPDYGPRYLRLMFHNDKALEASIAKLKTFCGWKGNNPSELQSDILVNQKITCVALAPQSGYDNFILPKLKSEQGGSRNTADKERLKSLDNAYNALVQRQKPAYSGPNNPQDEVPF